MRRLGLVLLCAGCSVTLMDHLPSDYRGTDEPHCDTGAGAAGLDIVLAGLLGAAAIAVAAGSRPDKTDGIAAFAALGVGELISAGIGYGWAGDCRRAKVRWDSGGTGVYEDAHTTDFQQKIRAAKQRMRCRKHPEECEPKPAPAAAPISVDAGVPDAAVDAAIDGGG
jgi:hypothetical protein